MVNRFNLVTGDLVVIEKLRVYLTSSFPEFAISRSSIKEIVEGYGALKAERDALAAELSRYSMSPGLADQYASEARAVRVALGFAAEAEDVAPIDLVERIQALTAENAALKSERSSMRAIGELIHTQDNRITDQPMFVVFQKREIIGSDEHSPSRIAWVWKGVEVDETRAKRLEALHQGGRDTRGYDRYAMQEIDVFVTACFTEQGCEEYLGRNGHNLNQPFIYAAGSYRNKEFQQVRNFLMDMTQTPATDAAIKEIKAQGVEAFVKFNELLSQDYPDSMVAKTLDITRQNGANFAARLRAGEEKDND